MRAALRAVAGGLSGVSSGVPSGARNGEDGVDGGPDGRRRAMALHPSAAHQKLRVLVSADAEFSSARIVVEGCVTTDNLHGLDLVVRRVGALSPGAEIILDLTGAEAWDTVRGDLLARAFRDRMAPSQVPGIPLRLRVLPPRD